MSFQNKTLGELAREDPRWMEVFYKYGMDFCCGGQRKLEEVCREKGIEPEALQKELERQEKRGDVPTESLVELCRYILERFHQELRKDLPEIDSILEKLSNVHGKLHPELLEMQKYFKELQEDIYTHLAREEESLFPWVEKVERGEILPEEVCQELDTAWREHLRAGEILEKLRQLSQGYQVPADGCPTYCYGYERLQRLERELMEHIHWENNVLFPRMREYCR